MGLLVVHPPVRDGGEDSTIRGGTSDRRAVSKGRSFRRCICNLYLTLEGIW
ncbi:hypothetical protein [Methanofollis sp. W23]|uniref:hypothetical protein n=1 Tax=Methanofollis sp. W23 TaxID=2817849 RepID=UPI001AE5C337|nr:hypothetical protein [Methanofollis sp. W23]